MKDMRFETKKDFEKFLDTSYTCVCGQLLTGFHELSCRRLQSVKQKMTGQQDSHPAVNVPKVTQ